jgi:hypothetical protein
MKRIRRGVQPRHLHLRRPAILKGVTTMKRTIRRGVFETNSSSTHSICIVPAEDFEAWKAGKMILANDSVLLPVDPDPNGNLTVREWDEVKREFVPKEVPDTAANRKKYFYDFAPYEEWCNPGDYDDVFERYEEQKTIKGVKVVVFGKYGYNG